MRWRDRNDLPQKSCECILLLDESAYHNKSQLCYHVGDYDSKTHEFIASDIDGWPIPVTLNVVAWCGLPSEETLLNCIEEMHRPAPQTVCVFTIPVSEK